MTATAVRRYANDGSLASVEAMLVKLAATFYPRVLGLGLPMDFDDVLQELKVGYVKALQKWNPDRSQFNTYCYAVCRNEFNRRIERMVLDRQHLGLGSIDDLASDADEEVGDGYERYQSQESEDLAPDERIDYRETLRDNLAKLSPQSRAVVRMLLANERDSNAPTMTLREIALHLGLAIPQMQAVQSELNRVFGVSVVLTRAKLRAA